MNYRYNCGDEVIRVGVWNDDFHTTVIVTDREYIFGWLNSIPLVFCTQKSLIT